MEESEKNGGFKVTDRRRFTSEDAAGQDSASEESEAQTEASSIPDSETEKATDSEGDEALGKTEPSQPSGDEAGEAEALPPLDFSGFVLGLANTALFQLGLARGPEGIGITKDIQGARQTIDLIAMLEEKTRGNLSDQEKNLIAETLFQLRMAFVEATK
ncbi:DUF1844 domain-containing protein [Thermodesulfobacteriota bacterium]